MFSSDDGGSSSESSLHGGDGGGLEASPADNPAKVVKVIASSMGAGGRATDVL